MTVSKKGESEWTEWQHNKNDETLNRKRKPTAVCSH